MLLYIFNYICFIYAIKTKYNDYSSYFEELYSFIDNYISQHIKTCDLKREWTWLLVYHTKHVSNFNLDKTYNKFKLKNNENNMKTNFELIAYLSKKIKYCNSQEHYFILDIIYKILINVDNLNNIAKSPEYSEQFKKLNRALSYLSFNINYSINYEKNMTLIEQKFVAEKLFKICNILFIESIDEYFWLSKRLKGYKNINEFINILDKTFNKILYNQSLIFFNIYIIIIS
jgi:hypothetical protein